MMLRDNGPESSFEEDVKALGIGHLFEDGAKAPAQKVQVQTEQTESDTDEVDGVEAAVAEAKGENPFAKYNAEKKNGKKDDSDADEKGDHEEPDGDEDEKGEEPDEDEDEDEDEKDEKDEQDDSLFGAMCAEDEKLGAAVDVIGSFYETLNESEDGAEFDHDALVGVIEAYEYMAEATGLLDEAVSTKVRRAAKRNQKRASKVAARMARAGRMKQSTKKAHSKGKAIIGGKTVRDSKSARSARAREMLQGAGGAKGKARARAAMMTAKNSDEEMVGSPITELVDNLAALKEAVQSNGGYRAQADELKEGFNSIGETASTWMESIAQEVKKTVAEGEEFDPDSDPRVQMGRHLDGIAESAAAIINKIDEGEANLEDAAADLQSLSADLNDAAEAMKEIA